MIRLSCYLQEVIDIVFPPRKTELMVRHATQTALQPTPRAAFQHTALLSYNEPLINALIIEAKFHNNHTAQKMLGAALRAASFPAAALFIPIPLSKKRYRERGYNQIISILHNTELPYAELLLRKRHTVPQTDLSREKRLQNIIGAFSVQADIAASIPVDTPLILIDDVTTTGATLTEGAAALRAAAFINVTTLALAH